jgi:haloacetate dehalogenase
VEYFPGFENLSVQIANGNLNLRCSGKGPAVLLLHGFPETHLAWRHVAPSLAEHFSVFVSDLPGYGDSTVARDLDADGLTKRAMAEQLVEGMAALGVSRFAVVGHDRGARVAYRMALDRPDRVAALGVLDVVPALEVAERLTYAAAREMVNWFFLAQPPTLPEEMIQSNPERYLKYILNSWGGSDAIEPEVFDEYARCFRNPDVIRAICAEYRAGDSLDIEHDRDDRRERRRIACPVLVIWAPHGLVPLFGDPLAIWRAWADAVQGGALDTRGHFIMEEAPRDVTARIEHFLSSQERLTVSHHARSR